MSKEELILSDLGHTWIFDIDGTLVKHNGYRIDGIDSLLPGVREFFKQIRPCDRVILITSRSDDLKEMTERYLRNEGIRFDEIIYNMPYGERILVNDRKTSGLETCYAYSIERDVFNISVKIDSSK